MTPRPPSNYSARLGSCDRRGANGRDASDRLLQPTFQRRALSFRVAAGVLVRQSRTPSGWLRVQRRSANFGQLVPAQRGAFSTPFVCAQGLTSGAPSPSGRSPARARRADFRIRAIEIASTDDPLRPAVFPIQDAFHRQAVRPFARGGSPLGARSPSFALSRDRERFQRPDACYRLLQPFTEQEHTERTPIPRAAHAVSAHSAALDGVNRRSHEQHGVTRRVTPRRRPKAPTRTGLQAGSRRARAVALEADSHLAEHLTSLATPPEKAWSFSADTERAKACLRSAARTVRTCHRPRCLRSPEAARER